MAEIAYGIVGKVLEQLGTLFYQEVTLAWVVRSDLKKLERKVKAIKAVLVDAEERQASDERLRTWLGELKDVLHDAEIVLDEFQYQVLHKKVMERYGSTSKKVRHFFSGSNLLVFSFKMAHKIKDIRERVDNIAALKDQFNLAEGLENRKIKLDRRDMTHSFVHPRNIIGRDNDKEGIINLLMYPDAKRNVSVIPIVGIGGMGKTTLAKLVYNDEWVVSYFELRMWLCVSDDFDVTRLIKEILKSGNGTIDETMGLDKLQESLRELVKEKKFLLVLDDVWNERRDKWVDLEYLLLGGCNGSKIIVTTRNNSVATIMGAASTYNLHGLSPKNCLALFEKLAFKEGEANQHRNLLEIGKEIVEKCQGVPLAVKTLANLLHSKVDDREWKFVRDNEIWNLKQEDGDILPALRLSYNQLPFHLKQSFVYCSLFPKDYEFKSIELIQFWMALGTLQRRGNEELEDVGDLYIEQLCSRSFFQDVDKRNFLYYTFKMHDLVHDLALSIAQGECSIVTKKSIAVENVRHLSFSDGVQEVLTHLQMLSGVRTILFQGNMPISFIETCISRFKYLLVLDLSFYNEVELSSSISNLKHLRYLSLCGTCKIKELPDSICKLYNLQTLLLSGCFDLERLPKDISNMISLRFLVVPIAAWTRHLFENGVGCLNSLRTLVIFGCWSEMCSFGRLDQYLTNLQTLVVDCCPNLTSLAPSIKHLIALEILIINDCGQLSLTEGEDNQDLKLRLRKLQLVNLQKMIVLPQWLQGSSNTLQHLKIEDCANVAALPEWLPSLKSLQTLEITNCPKLSSFPEGMQHITALRELRIEGCPELSRKCRQEDRLKIAHVPKIHLNDASVMVDTQFPRRSFHQCRLRGKIEVALLVTRAAKEFLDASSK